ncbi:MAG: diguanylate cyclase [Planctomycetota bacterium]
MKIDLHLFRITAATRLAIGLTMLCVSILLVASFLGLLPNKTELEAQATTRVCESIALQMVATDPEDLKSLEPVIENILQREPQIDSVGLRLPGGELLLTAGDHPEASPAQSSRSFLTVPISQDDEVWGTAEFSLNSQIPLQPYLKEALVLPKLVIFLAASCLLAFGLYLRRALRYLDPSSIVPERVRAAFDTMNEGVVLLDTNCQIALANRAFLELLGKDRDDPHVLGSDFQSVGKFTARDPDQALEQIWELPLQDGQSVQALLCRLECDEGKEHLVNISSAPIRTKENSQPRGVLVTFDNVTEIERRNNELHQTVDSLNVARHEIEQKNEELKRLATTDPLTGVLNRRAFFERSEALRLADVRAGRETSVIILDIDHFKSVNDNHGHARGDEVLKSVSSILTRSIRSSDVLSRYGGEEFCILLPDTPETGAMTLAEDLRQRIANSTSFGFPVTASFGVVTFNKEEGLEESIDLADQALYQAKENGRNRVIAWAKGSGTELKNLKPQSSDIANELTPPKDEEAWVSIPAVMGLVAAMEYRDPETAAHSRRVAELCVATAGSGLSARDAFIFEVAALLHDVGKIGVPDSILLKPGKLTEDERGVMNQHDIIGMEIVRSAYVFAELADIIRFHHVHHADTQTFDSAQPMRSLCARASLLGICDAYDAMTHDRPYRKAMPKGEAFAELRRCAPKQFDPKLVEFFIARQGADNEQNNPEAGAQGLNYFRTMVCIERLAIAVTRQSSEDAEKYLNELQSLNLSEYSETKQKLENLISVTTHDQSQVKLTKWVSDHLKTQLEEHHMRREAS